MRTLLASVVLYAAAASIVAGDRLPRHTVAAQRARQHPGPATVDVSADGRFVAFESSVALVAADRNSGVDIYVLDRTSGGVSLESVALDGSAANGTSTHPRLTGDGRYVVFSSVAGNLVGRSAGAAIPHVFLRDRHLRTTTLLSRTPAGAPANGWSGHPDISDDGSTVVFQSAARDLVARADRNSQRSDVYVFDMGSQTMERISVDPGSEQPTEGSSFAPAVSGNGRYVAFVSSAPLDGGALRKQSRRGAERSRQVYLRDLKDGVTRRVSRTPDGNDADGSSFHPAVSGDGRMVAFASEATNLGPRDRNRVADVYLHDTHTGQTTLVSRSARGGSAHGQSRHPTLSADGRFVAFVSEASDLLCSARCPTHLSDLNLVADVYLFDALTETVARVSGASADAGPWWEMSAGPALDATARLIAFSSLHAIDSDDVGHDFDLFVEPNPHLLEPAGTNAAMRRR
jgi:Tol biopolymer transport system component